MHRGFLFSILLKKKKKINNNRRKRNGSICLPRQNGRNDTRNKYPFRSTGDLRAT